MVLLLVSLFIEDFWDLIMFWYNVCKLIVGIFFMDEDLVIKIWLDFVILLFRIFSMIVSFFFSEFFFGGVFVLERIVVVLLVYEFCLVSRILLGDEFLRK